MVVAVALAATPAVKAERQGEALIQTRAATARWDKGVLSLMAVSASDMAAVVVAAMLVVAAAVVVVRIVPKV